jgi:hypothetical protein
MLAPASIDGLTNLLTALPNHLSLGRPAHSIMRPLCERLRDVRNDRPAEWRSHIDTLRASRLLEVLYEDPFTQRAFDKPRGYAGDAVLLDFIYKTPCIESALEDTTEIGRRIYHFTSTSPAPRPFDFAGTC